MDGRRVALLPEAETLIGDHWDWREFDNPLNGADPEEMRGVYYRASILDLEGDGNEALLLQLDSGWQVLDPHSGWSALQDDVAFRAAEDADLNDLQLWDYNADGRRDLVAKYSYDMGDDAGLGNQYIAELKILERGSGSLLKQYECDFIPDALVADFDGDGKEDLAIPLEHEAIADSSFRVIGPHDNELGIIQLHGRTLTNSFAGDIDNDGAAEIIYQEWGEEIRAAGLVLHDMNLIDRLDARHAMVTAQLDADPQRELVVLDSYYTPDEPNDSENLMNRMRDPNYDFEAEMKKQQEDMETMFRLMDVESEAEDGSAQHRLDTYRHDWNLSESDRRLISSELAVYDAVDGSETKLRLPKAYLNNNIPCFYGDEARPVRLAGSQSDGLFICKPSSGGVLLLDGDGECLHYEELGAIPLQCHIIHGKTGDTIMLVFEERIMVYP